MTQTMKCTKYKIDEEQLLVQRNNIQHLHKEHGGEGKEESLVPFKNKT